MATQIKVKPGDEISLSASFINDLIDMLGSWKQSDKKPHPEQVFETDYNIVDIRNDTDDDRERFDVVGLGDLIFEPTETSLSTFKNRPAIKGIDPVFPDHVGSFAVLLEPAKKTRMTRGVIAGRVLSKISVTDAEHKYADIADDTDPDVLKRLVSRDFGTAQIIARESGTGDKWALLRLGVNTDDVIRFELSESLSGGSAGAFIMAVTASGGSLETTETTVTVYNPLGIFSGSGPDDDYYGSRGYARFMRDTNHREIIQIQCNPTAK